jgi:hypothetical protein
MKFDYTRDFSKIDFRKQPKLYQIGKGEQGVLSVEPYKSEILPYWRFKTPEIAKESADKIYQLFINYLKQKDFVGADMARKFLQMGFTRSRRYANHSSGRKYSSKEKKNSLSDKEKEEIVKSSPFKDDRNKLHSVKTKTKKILPIDPDPQKAESAKIFYEKYKLAKENDIYLKMKKEHEGLEKRKL